MKRILSLLGVVGLLPAIAMADTIDPASYTDSLAVGESTTVRKTVSITPEVTSAVVDVMFVFDVTGSMGGEIASAKSSANSILSSLGGLGSLQSGTGWYSDTDSGPVGGTGHDGVHVDLNSGNTGTSSGINDMWDTGNCVVDGAYVGCGGDFLEMGYAAIADAANDASWRPGSNRFIVAFGDAGFKSGPDAGDTQAGALAALDANNVNLLGLSYSSSFTNSITGLGGTVGTGTDLVAEITDLVTGSLGEYSEVTVSDLGAGLPGVDVSVDCVSADIGSCSGATATGSYDRTVSRSFEFDVTFTGLATGEHAFSTHALVDGGIVASESDRFLVGEGGGSTPVPEPGALSLLGGALIGFGLVRRRRRVSS